MNTHQEERMVKALETIASSVHTLLWFVLVTFFALVFTYSCSTKEKPNDNPHTKAASLSRQFIDSRSRLADDVPG